MYDHLPPACENRVTLFRPNAGATVRFLVTCDDLVAINTHWTRRTRLCPGQVHCPACFVGLPTKWLAFVSVVNEHHQPGLLEINSTSAETLNPERYDFPRYGHVVTVTRATKFSGLRIVASAEHTTTQRPRVEKPEILDQVCRVLTLPRRRSYLDEQLWQHAIERAAVTLLELDIRGQVSTDRDPTMNA